MIDVSQYMKLLPYSLTQDKVVVAMFEAVVIQLREAYDDAAAVYDLVQVDKLPESLLDLIAYERHVDFYDNELDLIEKRNLIKSSISWHRKKGTPAAIYQVFNILNVDCKLKEWFEYGGSPYFFKLSLNIRNKSISEKTINLLSNLIDESKNLRSHLEGIDIYFTTHASTFVSACSLMGEEITVYPWQITNIDSKGKYHLGSTQQLFDTTTIYPKKEV